MRAIEINRFPVKSMQGEAVPETELGATGIVGDRRFAVLDVESGNIISAKQPRLGARLLECVASYEDDRLMISVGGAVYRGDDVDLRNDALSALLGRPVELVTGSSGTEVYESYWPEIEGLALSDVTTDLPIAMSTAKGTFVDVAGLHVVASGSVAHLGQLAAGSDVSLRRFRPSLVIETENVGEFVENDWAGRTARLGGATLAFGTASPRCVMTTVSQPGLPRDLAILQTLARENRQDFGGFGAFACLGVYAEVTVPGRVAVGDELRFD